MDFSTVDDLAAWLQQNESGDMGVASYPQTRSPQARSEYNCDHSSVARPGPVHLQREFVVRSS
ncbi:MAG: hypothetical protein GDA48_10645 [Hormoscilla sp. GM102CHS1]|nr:hypothetical protein [Hormoscilla sp. GM102CHS1]